MTVTSGIFVSSGVRQRGITTVEFALVGLLAFIILFGCLEFGRALYTAGSLTEGTRRAARFATVNAIENCANRIRDVAIFADGGPSFPGLSRANVTVDYLNQNGVVTAATHVNIPNIAYVRVGIQNYQLQLNIPAIRPTISMPPFETTLPIESLGFNPTTGTRICSS